MMKSPASRPWPLLFGRLPHAKIICGLHQRAVINTNILLLYASAFPPYPLARCGAKPRQSADTTVECKRASNPPFLVVPWIASAGWPEMPALARDTSTQR